MSQYTVDQLLYLIEENGGSQGLDLRGKDLRGIDLSPETIQEKRRKWKNSHGEDKEPPWYWPATGVVDLSGTNLSKANFWNANLSRAFLQKANLSGTHLEYANLEEVDLRNVESLKGAYFLGARLGRTSIQAYKFAGLAQTSLGWERKAYIGEEKDKDWDKARRAYHGLKVNWANQGEYDDARWAHRQEGHARRKELKYKNLREVLWLGLVIAYRWVDYPFWDYGQSPWRVLIWLVLLVLGFAGLYWCFGSLEAAHWYDYLLFSLRTSATLVFTEMGQTQGELVKFLTAIQGVIGLIGYAAFIYTLGRRSAGF